MAEEEEGGKSRKGLVLGLLAALGAIIGGLAFWRRRRGGEPEE